MRTTIKKAAGLVLALAIVATFLVATSGTVLAGQPPRQRGYEGNPGNSGNPGNQGGASGHHGEGQH